MVSTLQRREDSLFLGGNSTPTPRLSSHRLGAANTGYWEPNYRVTGGINLYVFLQIYSLGEGSKLMITNHAVIYR
jgi:hypothetical protein